MVLVDTSVWVDHFRRPDPELITLLEERQVLIHDFVIGELACGFLSDRATVLGDLNKLPRLQPVHQTELLHFIETWGLAGTGLGFVDVHLLAAVRLEPDAILWSRDRALAGIANRFMLN